MREYTPLYPDMRDIDRVGMIATGIRGTAIVPQGHHSTVIIHQAGASGRTMPVNQHPVEIRIVK